MTQMLVEEATHDGDFAEHLNLQRTRTFRGKEKNAFVHWYAKSTDKKNDPEDSTTTFHGIMAYHGYKAEKSKDPTQIAYRGEDAHREHRFSATVNSKGHVVGVQHHERFKDVNEETKPTQFGKKLRDVIGRKTAIKNTVLDSPSAASQKEAEAKFIKATNDGGQDFPDRNGNPDGFATAKSPGKKKLGPNAGKTAPMVSIKEEEQLDERSENYQFTAKAGDKDGERRIKRLKDVVHAFAPNKFQVKSRGRLGKDNPNAQKYKDRAKESKDVRSRVGGVHAYHDIDKKDAAHHDVYLRQRNEEFEGDQVDEGVRDIATSSRAWAGAKSSLGGSRDRQFGKKTYRLPGQAAKSDARADASKLVADYRSSGGRINAKKTNEEVEHIDEDGISHHYHVVDRHTKTVVGKAKTLRSAMRMSDKRNNEYGAHRYSHDRVEGPHPSMKKTNEEVLDERGDPSHPVEYYDAMNRERKAKWHYDRVGKNKNASFKKGISNDYEAELLKRGVKDSNGNQKSLRKEEVEELDEKSGEALHRVHINYDDPSGKGVASMRVRVSAKSPAHAKVKALDKLTRWPHPISGYKNAKAVRAVPLKEGEEFLDEDQIEEISKGLADRYARKASKDGDHHETAVTTNDPKKFKKSMNRLQGITRAVRIADKKD